MTTGIQINGGENMSYSAAVITVSDKGSRGERVDTSGPSLCRILEGAGYEIVYTKIIPDEKEQIAAELIRCTDELQAALVLTTGGTGFSPRDVTPEATLSVVERVTPGIPEAMRAESMKITPHGCLSREAAGIRGRSLIVNLPGSEKASRENLEAVLKPIAHGLKMLFADGSSDSDGGHDDGHHHGNNGHDDHHGHHDHKGRGGKEVPSMDVWLKEAKADPSASKIGMYLTHNGIVRQSAKAKVREGKEDTEDVTGMYFSYDKEKVDAAIADAYKMEGIYYIRTWLNEGNLKVGDDIMYVLIGGDIRPHVVDCLQTLVGKIKSECVVEKEKY